jgi:hypothetical protein
MPGFPADMNKARAVSERMKKAREAKTAARAERFAAGQAEIDKMRQDFAEEHGCAPEEVTVFACRRGRGE